MRATGELDNGTSGECCGRSIQTGIVVTDYGDTHVPGFILGPALAQQTGFLSLFAKVEKDLKVWAVRVEITLVAYGLTVQL